MPHGEQTAGAIPEGEVSRVCLCMGSKLTLYAEAGGDCSRGEVWPVLSGGGKGRAGESSDASLAVRLLNLSFSCCQNAPWSGDSAFIDEAGRSFISNDRLYCPQARSLVDDCLSVAPLSGLLGSTVDLTSAEEGSGVEGDVSGECEA